MTRNIVLSVGVSFFAKLMVLIQSSVITAVFGANAEVDVLFYMLSLIISVTTFVSAINQLVMVANLMKVRQECPEEAYRACVGRLLAGWLLLGCALCACFSLFGRQILSFTSAFGAGALESALPTVRVMAFVTLLAVVNTYLMDIFTAYRVFVLPMVNDLLKSALIIAFVLAPQGQKSFILVAWGMLVAYALQFVILQVQFKRVSGFFAVPAGRGRAALPRSAGRNTFFTGLTQAATLAETMACLWAISTLPGGVFTALSLSRRISQTVLNVVVVQFATVVGIELIDYEHRGDREGLARTWSRYLVLANYLALPLTAILMVNAGPIIRLLFGYGKFTQADGLVASRTLVLFALMLVTTVWDSFLQRLVVAKQLQYRTWGFQIAQSAIRVALVLALTWRLGYMGAPLGLVIGNLLFILMLGAWLLRHDFAFLRVRDALLPSALNAAFACAAAGIGTGLLRFYRPEGPAPACLLFVLASSLCMGAAYLLIGQSYHVNRENLRGILALLRRRLAR
ncbi:MAG: hypothetical protein LBR44_08160 [Clostridiales Family XIII bacterium]|jgi:putative peptidoglycan lipid II flippase|nr:hypothetical protein [Clostridiales Family XIII bacterium]